jgi:hypothetical protein
MKNPPNKRRKRDRKRREGKRGRNWGEEEKRTPHGGNWERE